MVLCFLTKLAILGVLTMMEDYPLTTLYLPFGTALVRRVTRLTILAESKVLNQRYVHIQRSVKFLKGKCLFYYKFARLSS